MKIKILLFLLLIPAFFFLLRPGEYWNMHDDMQVIRQLEMEKCFKDGQIPCRWSPDLGYGYGYPLFNYYPPLPYLVGEIFRVFGFSFIAAVKLTAIAQILLSALAMYICAGAIFGSLGGALSALFYTYAPYRNLNIYVRGAMNEAWASVFFPLIFYFSYQIIITKKFSPKHSLLLSLSTCGLLLSHNPMVLIFIPLTLLWIAYWLFRRRFDWAKIRTLGLAAVLSLGLSAFYTLPVLFESKLVQIESMFQNYYHYSVHYVSVYQLFISNFWSDGPSVWGTADQMSFMVGYLHWIVPTILLVYSLFLYYRKKYLATSQLVILLSLMGFAVTFMAHQKSVFIWQLFPSVQKIQFPWRFLNPAAFLFSLSVGALAFYLEKTNPKPKFIYLITLSAVILLLALNWPHITPITHGPITDNQKMGGKAWNNQITSGIYDYLPKTASTAAKAPAQKVVDEISPPVNYRISGDKSGTDWLFFNLDLKENATITLARLAFPGFKLFDFQQEIKYFIEPSLGRFRFDLQAGNHQIYLKLYNTPIRTIANYLSLLSWTFLIWKLLKLKK
ncbi:MAG: hypothetical protein AAB574_01445 [Patescibacteria group bacterium]